MLALQNHIGNFIGTNVIELNDMGFGGKKEN
jgi:hypothetical protein